MASRWLWCIFQLPLMSGLRSAFGIASLPGRSGSQGLEAGQVALLDVLERRAPTGGHVVDVVVEAEAVQRGRAVAAADDGERLAAGDGLGHRPRAGRKAVVLEHPHGPVPEDRAL